MAGPDPAVEARGPDHAGESSGRLFRAVWRWHFYAGLLVIPVVVLLSFSGIVYLFKPQLDGLVYGDQRSVEPAAQTVSYERQEATAQRSLGRGGSITSVGPPPEPDRATEFVGTDASGRERTVYVDPYTGELNGSRDNKKVLSNIALDMHATLLTSRFMDADGVWGDRLIELTASWAVVLVITGLYLWWPRGRRRSWRTAFSIRRRRAKGRRAFWRDLHAVTGTLFAFVFLFFLFTGLLWTGFWGEKTQELATSANISYPVGTFEGAESKTLDDVVTNGKPAWSIGQMPLAPSAEPRPGRVRFGTLRWDPRDGAPLDAVVGRAQQMGFDRGFSIAYPADEKGTYAVTLSPDVDPKPQQNALDERFAYLDQYTARPVTDFEYAEFGIYAQAFDMGIALHEGRQFGFWNQLFTLAATLALLISLASAVVMWRRRRPNGLGAPRREAGRRLGVGVLLITIVLGVLLPFVGLSIVAIVLLDFLVIKRLPRVRRALGAA